jgi:hypothetical protein
MTIVISLPFKGGLVIAADKRSCFQGIYADDLVKVVSAGRFTAVASSGTALCGTAIEGLSKYDFSATETIQAALKCNKPTANIRRSLDAVASSLKNTFGAFLRTEQGQLFPKESPLFISRIFHFDQKSKTFQYLTFVMHNTDERTELERKIDTNPRFIDSFATIELLTAMEKNDSKVQGLCPPRLLKILRHDIEPEELSEFEAIQACAAYIRLTADNINLIKSGTSDVSPTCDIAVIRIASGFEMVLQDYVLPN